MEHFKKRTVAICIASLITVLGAFGAENYSNSLMSLRINSGSNGIVDITAFTEKKFQAQIQTEVEGGGVYNIILPDTKNNVKNVPKITGYNNISSINLITYPYTPEKNGYTKIRIRTYGNPTLKTNTLTYIPDKQSSNNSLNNNSNNNNNTTSYWDQHKQNRIETQSTTTAPQTNYTKQNKTEYNTQKIKTETPKPDTKVTIPNDFNKDYDSMQDNNNGVYGSAIFGGIILFLVMLIYLKGRDKMAEVVGQPDDFSLEDNNNIKKKSIRKTIKKLDKTYSDNLAATKIKSEYTSDNVYTQAETDDSDEYETNEIIDLDSLFDEKNGSDTQTENETDDLADFLSTYVEEEEVEEEDNFDEEFYEKTLHNDKIKFSIDDNKRLLELIQNEISEDILNNISEYIPFVPVPKKVDKTKLMEEIMSEYAIKQNILFSTKDVDALKKLMNVELDEDFITDLRTGSKKNKKTENKEKKHITNPNKTEEIKTLKVHEQLPDLAKELEKIGNKRIESNAQPQVVYFKEGYDVSTINVNTELPDISKSVDKKEAWKHRPSDEVPYAVEGYSVSTMTVAEELPDMRDVKAHPEKYEDKKKEREKVDENALLNTLSHVEFKPFYEEKEDTLEADTPQPSDIKESEKENALEADTPQPSVIKEPEKEDIVEVVKVEDKVVKVEEELVNVEEDVVNVENEVAKVEEEVVKPSVEDKPQTPVITDKQEPIIPITAKTHNKPEADIPANIQAILTKETEIVSEKEAEEIIKDSSEQEPVEENILQNIEPDLKDNTKENIVQNVKPKLKEVTKKEQNKTIKQEESNKLNSKTVTSTNVVKTIECNDVVCTLLKNDNGYNIIGKTKNGSKYLKHYDSLKTENIQARVNEVKKDGTVQYLIRVSVHKFVIDVLNGNMEFVMDLC